MTQDTKFSRRQFLVLGCGALCAAALGSGCTPQQARSNALTACPFGEVNDPYPGKCHRYVDASGNDLCDYSESAEEAAVFAPSAPAGGAEPGVVDETNVAPGSGALADTSASIEQASPAVTGTQVPAATEVPAATPVPAATLAPAATAAPALVRTLCPRGLVNDPYPGRCRRYIDRNNNGTCDLSEVA